MYRKTHIDGKGQFYIKTDGNKSLVVSYQNKNPIIYQMSGVLYEKGTTEITKDEFDVNFGQVLYHLSNFKNQ